MFLKAHDENELKKDLELLKEYENKLRCENDPRQIHKYEQEINRIKKTIKRRETESLRNRFSSYAGLSNTEISSSQTNSSSPQTPPQLFEFLLQLDFKEQFKLVRDVLKEYKTVAFLVHGESNCGQQLLVNRLRRVKPEWHKHSPISINVSSRGIGYKLETMWGEVAKYMGQSIQTKSEDVFEAILDRLQTQDVIFIFSSIECMLHTKTLKPWLEQFWLPLVEMTKECIVEEDTHLLMFLVDNCGDVCQSKSLFSEQFNPLDYHPHIPLTLPPACPFSLNMIEDWLDLIIGIEELSILIRRDLTAQYLWENSQNGIPEYVFELICKHCGFRWEGGLAKWLI